MPMNLDSMACGVWKEVESGSIEEIRDSVGYTNPNLHRRISSDTEGRKYSVGVYGLDSYRLVVEDIHDEESTVCEIP